MRFQRQCAIAAIVSVAAACVATVACERMPHGASVAASDDGIAARRARNAQIIAANRASFDAFDSGSLGDATLEMIPYVIFRVLQELEPAAFGADALHSTGFFPRGDAPSGYHGITWTKPISPDGTFQLRYMTRTCSSCHTGRVRLADGTMRLIHGGANTEINVHRFIGRLTSTLKSRLSTSAEAPDYQAFRGRVLDQLATRGAEWYWGTNAASVSPGDAAQEVATATANIDAVLTRMRVMNDQRLAGLALLQSHSYAQAAVPPSLTDGAPGLVETSGLGSVGLVRQVGVQQAGAVLPPGPSKADIPAVWQIDPAGYANWDGTVRGFARSLTSSLAVVGDPAKIEIPANALIQDLLGKLPPEPFPFPIDAASRRRGEATFQMNCEGCHAPAADRPRRDLVFSVGTDPLRADAIRSMAVPLLRNVVLKICPSARPECRFDAEGPIVDPSGHRGYIASPLHGVWAVAPYLHNGSVPTLRQLLVPSLRTSAAFLRGSTSYDQRDGGWEWDPAKEHELRQRGDAAIALHDIRQTGFSAIGHGSDAEPMILDGRGRKVRIAWSDSAADRPIVDDLIAYLLSR